MKDRDPFVKHSGPWKSIEEVALDGVILQSQPSHSRVREKRQFRWNIPRNTQGIDRFRNLDLCEGGGGLGDFAAGTCGICAKKPEAVLSYAVSVSSGDLP